MRRGCISTTVESGGATSTGLTLAAGLDSAVEIRSSEEGELGRCGEAVIGIANAYQREASDNLTQTQPHSTEILTNYRNHLCFEITQSAHKIARLLCISSTTAESKI